MRGLTVIAAVGAAAFLIALPAAPAAAAGLRPQFDLNSARAVEPVLFGHRPKAISMYCYPRKYWWFYRPYTTAADNHLRCMPYFKYPQRGHGGADGLK